MPPTLSSRMMMGPVGTPHFDPNTSQEELQDSIIVACVLGYAMIGVLFLVCINNFRLAALPAWYKATERRTRDKALLGFWYFAAIFLWPSVLPPWLVCRLGFYCSKTFSKISNRRRQRNNSTSRARRGMDLGRWEDIPLDGISASRVVEQEDSRDSRGWRSTTPSPVSSRSISLQTIEERIATRCIQSGANAPSTVPSFQTSRAGSSRDQWELQKLRAVSHQGR